MKKDIALGTVGTFEMGFSGGKGLFALKIEKVGVDLSLSIDSMSVMDLLFEVIEKASPSGAQSIEESVKMILKSAIMAVE